MPDAIQAQSALKWNFNITDPVLIDLHSKFEATRKSYNDKTFEVDVRDPDMLAKRLYVSREIASKYYDIQTALLRYKARVSLRYRLFKLEALDSMSVSKSEEYPLTSDYENTKNYHYVIELLKMVDVQLSQMEGWNQTFSRLLTVLMDNSKMGIL